MKHIYHIDHAKKSMHNGDIYFDSSTKQRVSIVSINGCGNFDYFVEFYPVLMFGLKNKNPFSLRIHSSKIFNRIKVIKRP